MKKTLLAMSMAVGMAGFAGTAAAAPAIPGVGALTAIPVLGAPLAGLLGSLPGVGSLSGAGGAATGGLPGISALGAIPVLGPQLVGVLGGLPIPGAGSGSGGLPGLGTLTGVLVGIPVLGPPLASALGGLPIPGAGGGSGGGLPGVGAITGPLGNVPVIGSGLGLLVTRLAALPGVFQQVPGAINSGRVPVGFPLLPNTINYLLGFRNFSINGNPISVVTRLVTEGLNPDATILLLDQYQNNPYNGTPTTFGGLLAPVTLPLLDPLVGGSGVLQGPILTLGQALTSAPLPGSGFGL